MSVVLALDLSLLRTGIAIGSLERGPYFWSTFDTDGWQGNQAMWLTHFWYLLHQLYEDHHLTHIAYEETFVDPKRFSAWGTQGQQFFKAVVLLFARLNGLKIMPVTVLAWRAKFLPKGFEPAADPDLKPSLQKARRRQGWKRETVAECLRRGWEVPNDDMADALGILSWALGKIADHAASAVTQDMFARPP